MWQILERIANYNKEQKIEKVVVISHFTSSGDDDDGVQIQHNRSNNELPSLSIYLHIVESTNNCIIADMFRLVSLSDSRPVDEKFVWFHWPQHIRLPNEPYWNSMFSLLFHNIEK